MTADIAAYGGLFVLAFAAATVLPLQSEAALVGLILHGAQAPLPLVVVASLGNILGSLVTWIMGRGIAQFRHARWFPVSQPSLDRARAWYARWGVWSLLLSWAPIVGDALVMMAGIMRVHVVTFLILVSIAKLGRYAALAWVTLHFS